MSKAYEQSGVSLEAGYESVNRIKKHVAKGYSLELELLEPCLTYRP